MNIALQIEKLTSTVIAVGEPVVFDTVAYSSGNISYNAATGVITFNETGRYIVDWWVSPYVAATPAQTGVVFAMVTSSGNQADGGTHERNDQLSGIGIIDVTNAPVTMRLVNASAASVDLALSLPVKAALRVVEDDTVITGPTGATGPVI